MKRFLMLCAAVLLAGSTRADETKPRLDPGQAPDVQDVIFLGKSRPVLLRLHILVDGKPYSEAWDRFVKKLFDNADANNDGVLDENEIKRLPPATMMQQLVRGNFYNFYNQQLLTRAQIDNDPQAQITLEKVKAYYNKTAQVSAIQIAPMVNYNYNQPNGNQLTAALLRHLGGKDGKLDLKKLANTDDLVAKLDTNDDEVLDPNELMVGMAARGPIQLQPGGGGGMMGPGGRVSAGETSLVLVPKETGSSRLTERLNLAKEIVAKYDKDKSGKLTREEIGLDADSFKALDRNGDGLLDLTELLRYFVIAPDMELTAHLGKRAKVGDPIIHMTPDRKTALASHVRQASLDAVMLSLSSVQMEVRGGTGTGVYVQPAQQRQQYFAQFFNQVDQGKKGFIDLKKDMGSPNYQYMKTFFEMADRDNDGKVTKKEFEDMNDLHAGAFGTTSTLSVSETSRGLFELLDTNRDGRLSVRELRTAAEKLKVYDLNADGILSEDEIPVQVQLMVGSGFNQFQGRVLPSPNQPGTQPRSATAGPLWFRKMDRNGDGDVSRREFLGSPEEFKKLDLDGDGYISLEEAIKADEKYRAQKPPKK